MSPRYWYELLKMMSGDVQKVCSESLSETIEYLQKVNKNRKIDLVIMMSDCGAVLAHLFDTPIIMVSPAGPFSIYMKHTGNSINPIVQPSLLSPSIEPMTFFQRILNVIIDNIVYAWIYIGDSMSLKYVRETFGDDIPDFNSIMEERTVFALANSHIATHGSWPYYRNFAEIGGIHCMHGKELPADLKQYMDSHPDGVIYVSFGSGFKPSQMTAEQKKVFHDSFKELNMPIIWKWDDDDLTGIPKNVKVMKWVPQNDLLAHPNLKVFVTHGGLLSTQEALFHKVPLVGVPIALDQIGNLERAQRNGFALKLVLQTLTKEELVSSIKRVLTDENIRASMYMMHTLFTDYYDQTPMERGINAVEYVLKHKQLDFLKPLGTMNMSWYQYYGYDILLFVLLVAFFGIFIISKCFCCCLRMCCSKKAKQD